MKCNQNWIYHVRLFSRVALSSVYATLPLDPLSNNMYWSIMVFVALKRRRRRRKGVHGKTNSAGMSTSDLTKKMTAKCFSEKAPEGKWEWTCQILCIHNFFSSVRIWSFAFFVSVSVFCVCGCTLFCAHQFDLMLYLVIGKPKKERSHFVFAHTWLMPRTVSDWCSTDAAAAILDMTKFHFNVFPNIFIWISHSVPSAFNSQATKTFESLYFHV